MKELENRGGSNLNHLQELEFPEWFQKKVNLFIIVFSLNLIIYGLNSNICSSSKSIDNLRILGSPEATDELYALAFQSNF